MHSTVDFENQSVAWLDQDSLTKVHGTAFDAMNMLSHLSSCQSNPNMRTLALILRTFPQVDSGLQELGLNTARASAPYSASCFVITYEDVLWARCQIVVS